MFRGHILEEWKEGEWWRDDSDLLVDENNPWYSLVYAEYKTPKAHLGCPDDQELPGVHQ